MSDRVLTEQASRPATTWAPRWAAVGLAVALAAVVAWSTPWHLVEDVPTPDPALDFTSAQILRQLAFRHELLPWTTASWVLSLLVPLAVGFSPLGRRLYDVVKLRRWYLVVPVVVAVVGLLGSVVTLPTDVMAERVMRRYGLSTQDWALWTRDRVVNWLLMTLALTAVVVGLIACAKRWRRWWWAPAAIAAAALVVGVSFAYPVLVEPRFNHFTPMAAGAQRTEFMQLAAQDGVPVRDVLVADASKRTTALNAYVSGFGSTRRLVVYDTLLKDAPPAQVRLVVAHELGHAAEDDVLHGTLIGALGAAFAVVVLRLLMGARLADARRAAMVLALLAVATSLAAPVQNLVSRRIEARADLHSLRLTRDPEDFVKLQRSLAVTNLSGLDPSRWRYLLFADHPTPPERIAFGRAWGEQHGLVVPPLVQR